MSQNHRKIIAFRNFPFYNIYKVKTTMPSTNELLLKSIDLLLNSKHAIVFSGAGISTPSGIPDFRSPETGLWNKNDPFKVASIYAFENDPDSFFNWIKPLAKSAEQAKPNAAHICIAKLEVAGIVKAVITQNIDGLHQKAGSKNVLELHGTAKTATCRHCGYKHTEDYFKNSFLKDDLIPKCTKCGTTLKPDVVLFGEILPLGVWDLAYHHCQRCDLMFVTGSSLEVSPANSLPETAIQNRAKLIINNLSPTHLDNRADILLRMDVIEGIGKLCSLLRKH